MVRFCCRVGEGKEPIIMPIRGVKAWVASQ